VLWSGDVSEQHSIFAGGRAGKITNDILGYLGAHILVVLP